LFHNHRLELLEPAAVPLEEGALRLRRVALLVCGGLVHVVNIAIDLVALVNESL
jgi:hypothetical protein